PQQSQDHHPERLDAPPGPENGALGHHGPAPGPVPVTTGIPEYYVSTDTLGNLMASDTVTGHQLARAPSPDGYQFTGVTAAADDRTFVVVASTATERRSCFLVTLVPGSAQPLRLRQLPVPSVF